MQLIVSRLKHIHYGFEVSIKSGDNLKTVALINGNKPDYHGPIILLNIDQHTLYGLSHPNAISEIYEKGPQPLLTTKELGHRLYEHGMKASLGRIKLKSNWFTTTLDTYYTQTLQYQNLEVVTGQNGKISCLVSSGTEGEMPVQLSNRNFQFKEKTTWPLLSNTIEIDSITDYRSVLFKTE